MYLPVRGAGGSKPLFPATDRPREPRPDSEQQLGQKRDHRPLHLPYVHRASFRTRFSGRTRSDEKVTVPDSQTIIRLAVANSKMMLSSDSLETVPAVRIHLPPPSSPSIFRTSRRIDRNARVCARFPITRQDRCQTLTKSVARASPHIGDHAKARARDVFSVAWEFAAQEFLLKHRPDSDQYRRYDCDDGAGKRAEP
jgi:hypothetical protein